MAPMPDRSAEGTYGRIDAVVQRRPRGRVATYGQVAQLAGLPEVGIERSRAMLCDPLLADEGANVVVLEGLELGYLVRCSEAVEEV